MGSYRLIVVGLVSVVLAGCDLASLPLKGGGSAAPATASGGDTLAQARAQLAAGDASDSIHLYEVALEDVAAGSPQRSEALYGLALARVSAKGKARNLDKARQSLQTLLKEDPAYARRVEASALLGVLDDVQRERSQSAAAKRALGEKDAELAAAKTELASKERALVNLRKALLTR